jgi:large subunit ribosomal protein L3
MAIGVFGTKEGMTQLYDDTHRTVVPVTVIHADANVVLKHRTQKKNGYSAVQVALIDKKPTRVRRADAGQFRAASEASGKDIAPKKVGREIRLPADPGADLAIGSELTATQFKVGDVIDAIGTSKGKGFQGVMKRHHFAGFERSHGVHEYFRHGGSIGTRLTPGHVLRGKRMPGQMGNARVTIQNLTVVRVDAERGLVFVKGAIPGHTGAVVLLRPAVKAPKK